MGMGVKKFTFDHYDGGEMYNRVHCTLQSATPYVDHNSNKNLFVYLYETDEVDKNYHFSDEGVQIDTGFMPGDVASFAGSSRRHYAHVYTGQNGVRVHLMLLGF